MRHRTICPACNDRVGAFSSGLCEKCNQYPDRRAKFPRKANYGRPCGEEPPNHAPRLAEVPTDCAPGTVAKMDVMAARVLRGEAVFHPDDYDPCAVEVPVWCVEEVACDLEPTE